MIYNGTSGDSLIEDITFRTGVNTTQFKIADRNRFINEAYSRVANIIINADGRMSWDDANHPDQPITKCDLKNGQTYYDIFSATPSAIQDWLYIDRIDIVDSSGNGIQLQPIDQRDLDGVALSEFADEPSIPVWFDFNGTGLTLYPATNYDATLGMTIVFQRSPSYFSVSDTIKRPGFATIFHSYLSKYAANAWNLVKKKNGMLSAELQRDELEIGRFYSKRPSHYETPVLSNKRRKLMK